MDIGSIRFKPDHLADRDGRFFLVSARVERAGELVPGVGIVRRQGNRLAIETQGNVMIARCIVSASEHGVEDRPFEERALRRRPCGPSLLTNGAANRSFQAISDRGRCRSSG